MKKRLKTFPLVRTLDNGFTVVVYGELWEDGKVDGIAVFPCKFTRDGKTVMEYDTKNNTSLWLKNPYSRTKHFNMGWAICNPDDEFDIEKGIEICKKRFRKNDLTTQCGTFLTEDMIYAILNNEIRYIENHWDKYVKYGQFKPSEVAEKKLNIKKTNDILNEVVTEKEPESVDEKAPLKIEPGIFVMLKDENNDTHVIGKVKSVDEKKDTVLFYFVYTYFDNGRSLEYGYGDKFVGVEEYLHLVDHVATPKEVVEALGHMKQYEGVVWDENKKKIVSVR